MEVTIEYTYKSKHLETQLTLSNTEVKEMIDICDEEIEQYIRERCLDKCLPNEKYIALEHKEMAKYQKNKKVTIIKS